MLTLAEFQRRVTAELLNSSGAQAVCAVEGSGLEVNALRVHRGNIQGAWETALRLTFPAVVCLLGPQRFKGLAYGYARVNVPSDASFDDFGMAFPEFIAAQVDMYPSGLLIDLARFELALERVGFQPNHLYSDDVPLGSHVRLRLLSSVNILQFEFPVDLIRDAVDAARSEPLADLDLKPHTRHFAMWRGASGTTVKALSTPAAYFLEGLLKEGLADRAIESAVAMAGIPVFEVLTAIQKELFTATFLQIIHIPQAGSDR